MGLMYSLKCSDCDYGITVFDGIGMLYSPESVFGGYYDNHSRYHNIEHHDKLCEEKKLFLFELIEDEVINKKAAELLQSGAKPDEDYGNELYLCPQCMKLENKFYFKLITNGEAFEPDYHCDKCEISLQRVDSLGDYGKGDTCILIDKTKRELSWECPECGSNKLVFGEEGRVWD